MPTNQNWNKPLVALLVGSLIVNITGIGEHSPLLRLSTIGVAMLVWGAVELYIRRIGRIQDIWEAFTAPSLAPTRTLISGLICFPSLYVLVTMIIAAHGDRVTGIGVFIALVGAFVGGLWFGVEAISLQIESSIRRSHERVAAMSDDDCAILYAKLARASGVPQPDADVLIGVAYTYFQHPDDHARCLEAIKRHESGPRQVAMAA